MLFKKQKNTEALKHYFLLFLLLFVIGFQTEMQAQQKTKKAVSNTIQQNTSQDTIIPIQAIEEVPVYPGCEDLNNEERRSCMTSKLHVLLTENFNPAVAQQDSLIKGMQRINVQFTIGTDGKVEDIKTRSDYEVFEKEAERIVKLIPTMEPGKLKGVPVKVAYNLPIIFQLD